MSGRLHVDWTACQARGVCVELLPELLTADPWGYPMPRAGGGPAAHDVDVPDQLTPHARQAATLCPRMALRLLPGKP